MILFGAHVLFTKSSALVEDSRGCRSSAPSSKLGHLEESRRRGSQKWAT